jgi:hypothetical protein
LLLELPEPVPNQLLNRLFDLPPELAVVTYAPLVLQ